jgi:hypothetical protein
LDRDVRLTLIIPGDDMTQTRNLYHATAEERSRALDEIAEMNKGVPVLPAEAYNRESLYEDRA